MARLIYLDNAATTKPCDTAIKAFNAICKDFWGNPSSLHDIGEKALEKLSESREVVAECLDAHSDEIIFTSCATEANSQIIKCFDNVNSFFLTTPIEHHSILNNLKGCHKFFIKINNNGLVDLEELDKILSEIGNTYRNILVSVMYVNNEIGIMQPIKRIAEICKKHNAFFHCDATQAVGHIPIDVKELGVDFMTFSAHKFNSIGGCGGLYVNKDTKTEWIDYYLPLLHGGSQEHGFRAGTENLPSIYAMAKTLEEKTKNINNDLIRITKYTRYFKDRISKIDGCKIINNNTSCQSRIVNVMFDDIDNETMLLMLSSNGIMVGAGSACNGNKEPSHVLKAIGLSDKEANCCIRFSFGIYNTLEDVNDTVDIIKNILNDLRKRGRNYG